MMDYGYKEEENHKLIKYLKYLTRA